MNPSFSANFESSSEEESGTETGSSELEYHDTNVPVTEEETGQQEEQEEEEASEEQEVDDQQDLPEENQNLEQPTPLDLTALQLPVDVTIHRTYLLYWDTDYYPISYATSMTYAGYISVSYLHMIM